MSTPLLQPHVPRLRAWLFCLGCLGCLLAVFGYQPVLYGQGNESLNAAQANTAASLPGPLLRVIRGHGLPEHSYSMLVQEVGSDTPLLAVNPALALNPASTIKLLTTFVALETLGPAYTWKTELYALGPVVDGVLEGDLLLKGGGDPFLVEEQLRSMLKTLRRSGIEHIRGNLILDGSYFDASVGAAERIDNEVGRAYNTRPHATIANFQAVTFYFYPHPNGREVIIRSDPVLPNLSIDNRLRQRDGACSGYQRGISFSLSNTNSAEVIFSGSFPSRCTQYQMAREVLDAPDYTFGLFQALWQELGGRLEGTLVNGNLPDDLQPVLVWRSLPLADVIKSINKNSNNLMTRHLLLTLGSEVSGAPATVDKGVLTIIDWLHRQQLDTSTLQVINGAGLAREVRLSAALMSAVLQLAWQSPWMPEFVASLPLNGLDGTMRSRLRDEGLAGHMHIKTGTLDEVSAVAGYVRARSGRTFVVSALVNHELADRGPGTELTDALLRWVHGH